MELIDCGGRSYEYRRWLRQVKYAPSPAVPIWIPVEFREPAVPLEDGSDGHAATAAKSGMAGGPATSEASIKHGTSIAFEQPSEPEPPPLGRQLSKLFSDLTKHLAESQQATSPPFYAKDVKPLPITGKLKAKNSEPH